MIFRQALASHVDEIIASASRIERLDQRMPSFQNNALIDVAFVSNLTGIYRCRLGRSAGQLEVFRNASVEQQTELEVLRVYGPYCISNDVEALIIECLCGEFRAFPGTGCDIEALASTCNLLPLRVSNIRGDRVACSGSGTQVGPTRSEARSRERFRSTPKPRLWACCAPWRAGRSLGGRRLRLELVLRRARFVRSTCATFRLVEFAAASVHDNVGQAWGPRGGGIWLKWCKRL